MLNGVIRKCYKHFVIDGKQLILPAAFCSGWLPMYMIIFKDYG